MTEYSLNQKINYKLISACDCKYNCPNCFNQKVKDLKTQSGSIEEILQEVKSNPFHKGIIFAGLEWSLQIDECIALATAAQSVGLKTIVYTGADQNSVVVKQYIKSKVFDYIKYGSYREELATANHIEYGVVLASSNQHIIKKGVDY
jgi:pyruvate-formate lyase-activating enzyme